MYKKQQSRSVLNFRSTAFIFVVILLLVSLKKFTQTQNTAQEPEVKFNSQIENLGHTFDAATLKVNSSDKCKRRVQLPKNHTLTENEMDLAENFVRLADLKGSIHKKEIRKEMLAQLSRDPINIDIAKHMLSDLDWTLKSFPKQQAQVRIYSIELLKARAMDGDILPLDHEIRDLMDQMRHSTGFSKKGRDHDLSDLLYAWIESRGKEDIANNPDLLFQEFHYDPKFKEVFYRAYDYAIKDDPIDSKTGKLFSSYWNKTFKQ